MKFTEIKASTKRATEWIQARKQGYYLGDIYTSYSNAKYKAWSDCIDLCQELEGRNFSIISHNFNFFTIRFTTDEATYIITKSNNYKII